MGRPRSGYSAKDGKPVVGTTTITGRYGDKSAIIGWAAKTCMSAGHEAGRLGQGLPRWNEVLYGKRDDDAEAGTLGHLLFDTHLRGKDPLKEQDFHKAPAKIKEKAMQAFENALEWLESTRLTIIPFEKPLVSERYLFGGTPDGLAVNAKDITSLADWKTGGIYPEHLVQISAYKQLVEECEGIEISGFHLVRFSRDNGDFTHHRFSELDDAWETFKLWRAAYELDGKLKARAK